MQQPRFSRVVWASIFGAVVSLTGLMATAVEIPAPEPVRLFDDGWLDASEFLDTAYGFVRMSAVRSADCCCRSKPVSVHSSSLIQR
jgi:hypothetical protein